MIKTLAVKETRKHMPRFWLKELRVQAGVTQKEVAVESGIARSTYSQIELGIKTPSVPKAKNIALFLGFPWTSFYETEPQNSQNVK
ncbi:helix-turn-helix transcriptional regulator [Cytobacillus sp. IB215665]|uniref:helix-turn-helix transcriptional regulator n=1 Tax=Cytobacillus sp. IB215665 TaxID=3097357 RepID=UPI002A0CF901|nr:helix-turn-helix transcriptional regulator [Cytobacillus sp. IB215665]MDX8367171.1 helix-turn-helix transcriptional regulator [Cytobacillus sp. IB215665]